MPYVDIPMKDIPDDQLEGLDHSFRDDFIAEILRLRELVRVLESPAVERARHFNGLLVEGEEMDTGLMAAHHPGLGPNDALYTLPEFLDGL